MIAFFAVFCTLTVLAIIPVVVVLLSKFPGNGFEKVEAFLTMYDATLIALGTLFLVSTLAVLAAHLNNRSAEKRDTYNRRVQAALQVAQFRQTWIRELREELVVIQATISHPKSTEATPEGLSTNLNRVFLMLNESEDRTKELRASLADIGGGLKTADKKERNKLINRFESVSRSILKSEWERLKSELETAQKLEISD